VWWPRATPQQINYLFRIKAHYTSKYCDQRTSLAPVALAVERPRPARDFGAGVAVASALHVDRG
jgi:hypothetical protein